MAAAERFGRRRLMVVAGLVVWGAARAAEPGGPQAAEKPPAAPGSKTLPDADARAVRAVVEAQLEAFAAEDAARAFSYASPAIRRQFGDATAFLAMVRQGYPMVIRPAARSFYRPQAEGEGVWQAVLLRDAAGKAWRAVYELQRQPDRSWRINGCRVIPDDGRSST